MLPVISKYKAHDPGPFWRSYNIFDTFSLVLSHRAGHKAVGANYEHIWLSTTPLGSQPMSVESCRDNITTTTKTTTILRPFVWDYLGEPVQEETLTHPPSWSSSNLYQLLPSTMIHSILLVQITCLAIFVHNLSVSSLVYLLVWSPAPHIPYIPLPNQCLLFVAHAHTVCTESALKCERSNNLQ